MTDARPKHSLVTNRQNGPFPRAVTGEAMVQPGLRMHVQISGDACATRRSDGDRFELTSGLLAMTFDPEPASWLVTVDAHRDYRGVSLHLPLAEIECRDDLDRLSERSWRQELDPFVLKIASSCLAPSRPRSLVDRLLARSREYDLFAYVLSKAQETGPTVQSKQMLVREAVRRMQADTDSFPDTRVLADGLGVTPARLRAAFPAVLGVSYADFVAGQKLDRACRMLRDPALHVAQIAYALGYGSPANFTTAFKRQKNMTPSDWRQRFL